MRFRVCPRCGSKNIFAGKMSSGILFGVSSWLEECRNCGYKGSPVIFDSEKEYLLFLKHIKSIDKQKKIEKNDLNEEENDKNLNYSNGMEDHWHLSKWWVELLVAGLLAIIVSLITIVRNISLFGLGVGVIYTVLEFIIFFIFILIGIVILEYFGHIIHKKKFDQNDT